MASAIGLALKKFNEGDECWDKEREERKSDATLNVERVSVANIQTEGFIFENSLGYPLTFYLQSMSGEKVPKETYRSFSVGAGELLFLSKSDLRKLRRSQAAMEFGQSLKLISEDVLRILVRAKDWGFSPGIPIELARCHSFLFKHKVQKTPTSFIEYRYPTVCRIRSNVSLSHF